MIANVLHSTTFVSNASVGSEYGIEPSAEISCWSDINESTDPRPDHGFVSGCMLWSWVDPTPNVTELGLQHHQLTHRAAGRAVHAIHETAQRQQHWEPLSCQHSHPVCPTDS